MLAAWSLVGPFEVCVYLYYREEVQRYNGLGVM